MAGTTLIGDKVWEELKQKLEEDSEVRHQLFEKTEKLERDVSYAQGVLSRVHSTPPSKYSESLLPLTEKAIQQEIETVKDLAAYASKYPYYKYNTRWSNHLQNSITTVLLCGWLGGLGTETRPGELGRLLTLEEVGEIYQVPINLKDTDAFHITVEEYLLGLVSLVDELGRLAVNAVTLRDYALAVRITAFVKDVHAGFQLLNLKNDNLRRRIDGVKYAVKKVEDVIYDLSLRNLLPATEEA